ncbi:hypothetical protein [Vitreimonas sp.]|uniref:hypothetical protein n=1 Tax=Vitreimonas sp. TaxID=3069702 RepID=UPI002ED919D3
MSDGGIDSLFANHGELLDWLDVISVRPARPSTREQTFQRLLAAWATSKGVVTLRQLINSASTGPDALIGPIGESVEISQELADALHAIPDFSFEVRRNHLAFAYRGITGYAAYHCLSDEFAEMEAAIIARRPSTFGELHQILRGQV